MSDTLKLYPPPENGRWKVEQDGKFHWVRLIIRTSEWFGDDYEVGCESVYRKKFDIALRQKREEALAAGDMWTVRYTEEYVPRTEAEMDKAIWEASREIVRKHNRENRPHEYVTEWEDA